MSNVVFQLLEYGRFLGDPASAIWRAFTKLAEDLWLSKIVLRATDLKRELLAIALLGGQSELDRDTTPCSTPLTAAELRDRLECSLDLEGDRLWDDIDSTELVKVID